MKNSKICDKPWRSLTPTRWFLCLNLTRAWTQWCDETETQNSTKKHSVLSLNCALCRNVISLTFIRAIWLQPFTHTVTHRQNSRHELWGSISHPGVLQGFEPTTFQLLNDRQKQWQQLIWPVRWFNSAGQTASYWIKCVFNLTFRKMSEPEEQQETKL